MLSRNAGTYRTYQVRCLDLHLELQVGSRVTVGLGDLQMVLATEEK